MGSDASGNGYVSKSGAFDRDQNYITTRITADGSDGYRIARRDYELPDIHLEPDEAAAVGLATRLWQSAQLAEAAGQARLKLAALGGESDLGAFRANADKV